MRRPSQPTRLVRLFHRRWAVPVIAELHNGRGSKLVTLVHRLDASPGSIRSALDHLIELGWVVPNPGYGHPMRPEYVLTVQGERLGPACSKLMAEARRLDIADVTLRRWSMPVLHAVSIAPAHFGDISRRLVGLTDRALSLALHDLRDAALVARTIIEGSPPTTVYRPTRRATLLCPILAEL
jgi:DNA-binding HxlR family transcriptional regulator